MDEQELEKEAIDVIEYSGVHFVLDTDWDEALDKYKECRRKGWTGRAALAIATDMQWKDIPFDVVNLARVKAEEKKAVEPDPDSKPEVTSFPSPLPIPPMGQYSAGLPQIVKVDGGTIYVTTQVRFVPDQEEP